MLLLSAARRTTALSDNLKPPLLPLDRRDTAHALHQALAVRRFGHAKNVLDSTLHGVMAELLADALMAAGYVVAIPEHRDPNDRRPLPSNPHLTD